MLRATGFVLKKTNIGDFDVGYCFFTKKYGKINLTARSVKKPLSKLAGQLEPPSLVNFIFSPAGNGGVLTTALAKKSFLKIRRDFDKLNIYLNWCSLIYDFTFEKQKDDKIWHLLKSHTQMLCQKNPLITNVLFVNAFLNTLGFNLISDRCVNCQKLFATKTLVSHDFAKGGFVCRECLNKKSNLVSWELFEIIQMLHTNAKDLSNDKYFIALVLKNYSSLIMFWQCYLKYIKNFY